MIVKLHRANAMALLVFLGVHFASHLAALLGPATHGGVLAAVRPLYRAGLVEPALLAAFAVQVALGMVLVFRRLRLGAEPGWGVVQIASGVYLAAFILIHLGSALVARFVNGLDTNFWWPASTLAHGWLRFGFYPYYALAVCALFAHLAAALHYRGGAAARWARAVAGAGPLVAAAVLAGYGGWFHAFTVPARYMTALAKVVPGA